MLLRLGQARAACACADDMSWDGRTACTRQGAARTQTRACILPGIPVNTCTRTVQYVGPTCARETESHNGTVHGVWRVCAMRQGPRLAAWAVVGYINLGHGVTQGPGNQLERKQHAAVRPLQSFGCQVNGSVQNSSRKGMYAARLSVAVPSYCVLSVSERFHVMSLSAYSYHYCWRPTGSHTTHAPLCCMAMAIAATRCHHGMACAP